MVLTVLGLFSGASIGREGPTVQVGASVMLAVARFGGMAQARGLILAGSAAGIAAFNTPLPGIVFASEEMSRTCESQANRLVFTAVILSGLAALGLAGSYNYFGEASAAPAGLRDWGLVLVCGIGGGALGAGFSGVALDFAQRIRRWAQPQPLPRMLAVGGRAAVSLLRREVDRALSVDVLRHSRRHLRPVACRRRRLWEHDGIAAWNAHRARRNSRNDGLFFRRSTSADDSLRDHPIDDGGPSGGHPHHGRFDARLRYLANPVAGTALSRPLACLHRCRDLQTACEEKEFGSA